MSLLLHTSMALALHNQTSESYREIHHSHITYVIFVFPRITNLTLSISLRDCLWVKQVGLELFKPAYVHLHCTFCAVIVMSLSNNACLF